jgi:hypothetical protein
MSKKIVPMAGAAVMVVAGWRRRRRTPIVFGLSTKFSALTLLYRNSSKADTPFYRIRLWLGQRRALQSLAR